MTSAEQERAAIVAWLRGEADWNRQTAKGFGERGHYRYASGHAELAGTIERWAAAIESGAHRQAGEGEG